MYLIGFLRVKLDVMSFISTTNIYAQINDISLLDGTNFDVQKEVIEIILYCIDLDMTLCMEKSIFTPENLDEVKIEKWERYNRMCLMIMKHSILEAFQNSISESQNARKFIE
ncbi:hypothetical protein Lal_00026362 [Lupinus albus]|nr:hypothetical protein Lal_00026362 [Lupinus albus]